MPGRLFGKVNPDLEDGGDDEPSLGSPISNTFFGDWMSIGDDDRLPVTPILFAIRDVAEIVDEFDRAPIADMAAMQAIDLDAVALNDARRQAWRIA